MSRQVSHFTVSGTGLDAGRVLLIEHAEPAWRTPPGGTTAGYERVSGGQR